MGPSDNWLGWAGRRAPAAPSMNIAYSVSEAGVCMSDALVSGAFAATPAPEPPNLGALPKDLVRLIPGCYKISKPNDLEKLNASRSSSRTSAACVRCILPPDTRQGVLVDRWVGGSPYLRLHKAGPGLHPAHSPPSVMVTTLSPASQPL